MAGVAAPWRVAVRQVRGRRLLGTALFVVVVALAGAAMIVGISNQRSAAALWDDAFEQARAPHVILYGPDGDELLAVADDPRVVDRTLVDQRDGRLVDSTDRVGIVVREADAGAPPSVGAPDVVTGRLAIAPDELALERSFADDLGIDEGDTVELLDAAGDPVTFQVVGIVLDFQDCFWPQCDPGVAWADPTGADRLGGEPSPEALLRLADADTAPAFTTEVLEEAGDRLTGAQDWLDTRGDALATDTFFGAFLTGFGVFVLVAAGVVVAGSVSNRAASRRRDIGLLKSIGFTPRQVVTSTVMEHLVLAAIGLLIGWVLAVLLAPEVLIGVAATLGPPGRTLALGPSLLAAAVLGVLTVAATVPPTVRMARLPTAGALASPTAGGGRSRLGRLAGRARGGPVVVAGLKDALDRPLRAALATASVVLAIVALLVTTGVQRTVDDAVGDPAAIGDPWDASVSTPDRPAAVEPTISGTPGAAGYFTEWASRAPVDGEVVLVRALGGDPAAARFEVLEGRPLRAAGEAIAGFGLLDLLGRSVGDTVTVTIADTEVLVTIVGRYGETEDGGEVLQLRHETIDALLGNRPPDLYRVTADDGVDADQLAGSLRASLGPSATVEPLVTDTEGLDAFWIAFVALAALVLAVALANVGATVLLGVHERRRDAGVLRAVGFTPAQLVAATGIGTAVLAVLAVVVGVPLGLWAADVLLRGVGEAIGYGPELAALPRPVTVVAVAVGVAAATIAVGAAAASRTASRSASELVRYE